MSNPLGNSWRARPWFLTAVLACLPFLGVLGFGFAYDDHWTVETNRFLDRPLGELVGLVVRGDGAALGLPDASRPAMVVSAWLDRRLFGRAPMPMHLVSLGLHAVAAAVATWLGFVLTRNRTSALIAGAFFAVAPVHAEVVASINYREDLFATIGLFVALALLLAPAPTEHRWGRAFAVASALALGLLGKESAAIAPVLFVVLALALGIGARGLRVRERSLTLATCVLVFYLMHRYAISLGDDGVARGPSLPWLARCASTGRYLAWSTFGSLLPFSSKPFYAPLRGASLFWLVVPFLLSIAVVSALRSIRHRTLGLGLVLASLAPLASAPITSAANEFADRYLYASTLGGGLVFAWVLEVARARVPARARTIVVASVLALSSVTAAWSASAWHDDLTLFTRAVAVSPTSARAHLALAWARRIRGDLAGAERSIERASALEPRSERVELARGMLALARGDRETAARIGAAIAQRYGEIPGLAGLLRCSRLEVAQARRCGRSITFP